MAEAAGAMAMAARLATATVEGVAVRAAANTAGGPKGSSQSSCSPRQRIGRSRRCGALRGTCHQNTGWRSSEVERAAERARQREFEENVEYGIAARKAAALARQLEMESLRLEAALRRKAVRGVSVRGGLPSLPGGGSVLDREESAASGLGNALPAPPTGLTGGFPMLPPMRIGPGVDF